MTVQSNSNLYLYLSAALLAAAVMQAAASLILLQQEVCAAEAGKPATGAACEPH